jgi:hypothetical protein
MPLTSAKNSPPLVCCLGREAGGVPADLRAGFHSLFSSAHRVPQQRSSRLNQPSFCTSLQRRSSSFAPVCSGAHRVESAQPEQSSPSRPSPSRPWQPQRRRAAGGQRRRGRGGRREKGLYFSYTCGMIPRAPWGGKCIGAFSLCSLFRHEP